MLRKLITMLLAALMLVGYAAPVLAESGGFPTIEKEVPEEPTVTDEEYATVVAEYDADAGVTHYTVTLKDTARFADGTPVTAEDLLFTYYAYLDPGHSGHDELKAQAIPGLVNYVRQITGERLDEARAAMKALEAAGREHSWSESDAWTKELQEAYWALRDAYDAASLAEYPNCAQAIVDYCIGALTPDSFGAFGLTAEEIAENTTLHVAYAMVQWGYAFCEDDATLISSQTRTVWPISDGIVPTLNDFVNELKAVYGNDISACWAIENPGNYEPALPEVEWPFIEAYTGGEHDLIPSIEGVRINENGLFEVTLEGIRMGQAHELFHIDVLSLNACGDAAIWNPEAGSYGHPFGDVSAVEAAATADNALKLLPAEPDPFFG